MVYNILKLVLEFRFDHQNPVKQPKMWIFEKWKFLVFSQNYGIFGPKGDLKPCIIMYLGNIHNMSMVQVTFGIFFFQILKMALFGLNWGESKWPGHFCSKVLNFFASKIGVKLPPEKKFLDIRTELMVKLPFFSKKCIFRAEKGIFSKSSFYSRMFSDPKYSFSVCQQEIFLIQSKVNIFHQIQPTYIP